MEFDRGFEGLPALGAVTVSVAELGSCASVLISGVIWSWVVGDSE